MHLITLPIRLRPQLARLVEELDTREPFLRREVNLSGEVVQMADRGAEDLLEARARVWAAGVDDVLGEVRVVLVLLLLLAAHLGGVVNVYMLCNSDTRCSFPCREMI